MKTTSSLRLGLLPLVVCLTAATAQAQDDLAFWPGLNLTQENTGLPGEAVPGQDAYKAKIVRLVNTPGTTNDGRLVVVYGEANHNELVWNPKEGEHFPRDLFTRYSDDQGYTWSDPVNLSNTADKYSAQTDWNGDGVLENYWGDSEKPNVFANGNNVVVSWIDKYMPEPTWTFGDVGQSAVQGLATYPDIQVYPNQREVPFAGVYMAISNNGGATWTYGVTQPAIQLTYGLRDAKQDVHRGAGPRWIVTWQEDPEGLQPGEADGPGTGASGANVSKGTDIWYSFTTDLVNDALALRTNRQPLSNQSEYDLTAPGAFPTVGSPGSIQNHGASRANTFLLNDGGVFKALVAYEETKGIPDVLEGKTVQYHAFPFDAPLAGGTPTAQTGVAGTTLTDTLLNARRVRFVAQPPNGVDPAIALFYRLGFATEGGPADIMLRISTSADEASVLAAPELNMSTNTPNATSADLLVGTEVDMLEDARAHRAVLVGSFLGVGYTYTWNGPLARYTDMANYNFWMRRSLDGGLTWLDPEDVSKVSDTKINVKEPRLVKVQKTSGANLNAFLAAWGTETNVYEGLAEPVPLDIEITRTLDLGATFATVTKIAGSLGAEYESQLAIAPDASEIYGVWMDLRNGATDAKFAKGGLRGPVYVDAGTTPPIPGDLLPLFFHAPGFEGDLLIAAASLGFNPGAWTVSGDLLPLNPDLIFHASLRTPRVFQNFVTVVDPSGVTPAFIQLPTFPGVSGLSFYVAFAVLPTFPAPLEVSLPVLIEVL